jgi:hypothetical protein
MALYEFRLDARTILDAPDQTIGLMEQAIEDTIGWGRGSSGLAR